MREDVSKQSKVMSLHKFHIDEFLLYLMINLILLTVDLSIFNVCFLLIFITTALKFYKTNVMEKHVDLIEIPAISTEPKTSIVVHWFSIVIHDVLTNKSLVKNFMYLGIAITGYFLMKWMPVYVLLMIIVDVEYAFCLLKRRKTSQKETKRRVQSQVQQKPSTNSSTQSSSLEPTSSFMYLSSSLKPTRSSITQNESFISQDLSQFSQSPKSPSHHQMRIIEQVEEDKILDQDLPQISMINIISARSSIQLR